MGFCSASHHLSYKLKLLMLITLCVLVTGWATSTYLVDTLHETPTIKGMVGSFRKPTTIMEKQKENSKRKAKLTGKLPIANSPCPSLSPYLRGPSKLTFRASLTLEEVQKENPSVAKGRHNPKNCTAQQRVAILIPHRNREKHLLYLLEHLHPFLQRQQLDYGLYVIHQAGSAKFNRAKLLNVGYLEALKEENWDCFIFHDVDLVPENDFNIYICGSQPKHLVVGRNSTGYRLRYQGYFGGVTALTREQFLKVNGFSNNYWGWGGEDDDLRISIQLCKVWDLIQQRCFGTQTHHLQPIEAVVCFRDHAATVNASPKQHDSGKRVEMQKMKIIRPSPSIAKYTMIFHTRDQGNEANGQRMNLLRQVSRVWKTDGLNSCSYKLLSKEYNPLYTNITVDFGRQAKFS